MAFGIYRWFNKKLPRNFILEKPYAGSLIFMVLTFGFATLYKPLQIHGARSFSLWFTIAAYCCIMALLIVGAVKVLRHIPWFSDENDWTILKELLSIAIILIWMGIGVYFAAFLVEVPADRWNFSTFFDSCKNAFLIGIIPFGFFTLINYRYIFFSDKEQYYTHPINQATQEPTEELIRIGSQLKKEEVSFYPGQFVYAESDGNYVVFHLNLNGQYRKKIVRNSINNIEKQLSAVPFIMRTHRAFIVNLTKVHSKKGNTLGYRLKMSDIDTEIPVSRNNTRNFDMAIRQHQ